jgi:hypothetical protein
LLVSGNLFLQSVQQRLHIIRTLHLLRGGMLTEFAPCLLYLEKPVQICRHRFRRSIIDILYSIINSQQHVYILCFRALFINTPLCCFKIAGG